MLPIRLWLGAGVLLLAGLAGVASAQMDCQPSSDSRGHNTECKMSHQCGWAHFCVQIPCSVNGQELLQGCWPPGFVQECLFLGVYTPL